MYYTLCKLFGVLCCSEHYIWMDVELIAETRKAILVRFDNRTEWIPKAWISNCKHCKGRCIKIKISEYHWAKKFL